MKLVDLVARYLGQLSVPPVRSEPIPSAQVSLTDGLPSALENWPSEWLEVFEERAGIMEFDGYLARTEADLYAEACVREVFRWQRRGGVGWGNARRQV